MQQKSVLFVGVIFVLLSLLACSHSVAGKYVNRDDKEQYLELKRDHTFFLRESGEYYGKYEVEGETITLKLEGGIAARGEIKGNTITDKEGKVWIKQE